jgi:hypothetical protein
MKRRLRRRLHNPLVKGETPISRQRAASEGDVAQFEPSPLNPFRCVHVKDSGLHEWGQEQKAALELKHEFIETDGIKELINNAAAKLLTESQGLDQDCASPLNHSVTISWELNDIEKFRSEEGTITPENCLIHVLEKMNMSAKRMVGDFPPFDSLAITSMENRSVRKNIHAVNSAEPLVVMHMGNDRALNIIPKKFTKEMMDVLNVTLGNFSAIIAPHETHQQMNFIVPYESMHTDNLDLHLLITPYRAQRPNIDYSCERLAEKEVGKHRSPERNDLHTDSNLTLLMSEPGVERTSTVPKESKRKECKKLKTQAKPLSMSKKSRQ